MRGLSVFFMAAGLLSIFGSFVSIGLTFLGEMRDGIWAPTRTGSFVLHYLGIDLDSFRFVEIAGVQPAVSFVLDEQLYKTAFVLGLLMLFGALVARGVQER
ncbi:MAG TPA: hypothetical protein VMC10_15540 [Stellaceae bacterium]|nr:hypothetical protein [Stellaceae bacterium]